MSSLFRLWTACRSFPLSAGFLRFCRGFSTTSPIVNEVLFQGPQCVKKGPDRRNTLQTSRGENRKLLAFFAHRWCSIMCSLVPRSETHSRMCVDLCNLGGWFSIGDLPSKSGALFLGCCLQVRSCQDTSSKRSHKSLFRPVFELLQLCPHSFPLLHSPQICQTEAGDLAGSRIFV